MRHPDERILLAEPVGDRPQGLVHNHCRIERDLAFLARALDQLLLAIRPVVLEDIVQRLGGGRVGAERVGAEHDRECQRNRMNSAHACPPVALASISASAIRTPRPRAQTRTGLRSIAAYCPSVATTKSPKRTQQSMSASTSRGAAPRKPSSSFATLRLPIAALASLAANGGNNTAASLNTSTVTPPAPQTTKGPNVSS